MNYFKPFRKQYEYYFHLSNFSYKQGSFYFNKRIFSEIENKAAIYEKIYGLLKFYGNEVNCNLIKNSIGNDAYNGIIIHLNNCDIKIIITLDSNFATYSNAKKIDSNMFNSDEALYNEMIPIFNEILNKINDLEEERLKENNKNE